MYYDNLTTQWCKSSYYDPPVMLRITTFEYFFGIPLHVKTHAIVTASFRLHKM